MSENNSDVEQTKSAAKVGGGKKIKSSEFSLRVHLKGEVAKQVRNMADRASKNTGYPVPEGLIVVHALDLKRADEWLKGFVHYLDDSIQHNA